MYADDSTEVQIAETLQDLRIALTTADDAVAQDSPAEAAIEDAQEQVNLLTDLLLATTATLGGVA
jgi:hypothetical protein